MDKRSWKAAVQVVRDLQFEMQLLKHTTHALGRISTKYHNDTARMELEVILDKLELIRHAYAGVVVRIEDEHDDIQSVDREVIK